MSKYDKLWAYVGAQAGEWLTMTFAQIEEKGGLPIDHAFLTFKKELTVYGWQVGKISMKQQTVTFVRTSAKERA